MFYFHSTRRVAITEGVMCFFEFSRHNLFAHVMLLLASGRWLYSPFLSPCQREIGILHMQFKYNPDEQHSKKQQQKNLSIDDRVIDGIA